MKGKRARSFRRISSMSTLHPSTDQHDPDSAGQQALPAAVGNAISLGMGMDMVMGMLDGARVPPHKWKRGVPDACSPLPAAPSFLEVCFSCNRTLGHGRDIYIYRGDTAFCSEECRQHQIAMDEHRERFLAPPQAIAAVNK